MRAYHEGDKLKLATDEKAECYYDFNSCFFNTNNATLITTGFSNSHSADWKRGLTYHIKCADVWGNKKQGCTIKILPSFFG